MLLAKFNAEFFQEYIDRLQMQLKRREGDPEFTGVQRPTEWVFNNAKKMLNTLCNLPGQNTGTAKMCVTYDGKFEIRFNVYDAKYTVGVIRVEDSGFRFLNGYTKESKFVSADYKEEDIQEQLKKYMKNYL